MTFSGVFFFFNDTATTEIYTLSLHDALPISPLGAFAAALFALRAQALRAQALVRWSLLFSSVRTWSERAPARDSERSPLSASIFAARSTPTYRTGVPLRGYERRSAATVQAASRVLEC